MQRSTPAAVQDPADPFCLGDSSTTPGLALAVHVLFHGKRIRPTDLTKRWSALPDAAVLLPVAALQVLPAGVLVA